MATLATPQDTLTSLLILNISKKSLSIVPKVAIVGSFDCNMNKSHLNLF